MGGADRHDVPRKLWLLRGGHVDPFDARRAAWVDTLHRWFDHWLLGVDNGIMDEPRVDIEEEKDVWHTYADWPVPGTTTLDVFLHGGPPTAPARWRCARAERSTRCPGPRSRRATRPR